MRSSTSLTVYTDTAPLPVPRARERAAGWG